MFTALVVTRWLMKCFYALGLQDAKFYGKAKERKTINFLGKKAIFFALSVVVIVAGFVGMVILPSTIADNAFSYPSLIAVLTVFPAAISSRIRAKIITLLPKEMH